MPVSNEMSDELRKKILEKIKSGKAKMRPKWRFVLKTLMLAAGFVIATLTLLYIVSFILFILRQTGAWSLPSFGLRGIGIFLVSLPRLLILATIIFIILLEILVRHYSFAWRKPILYSLLGIIIFVIAASVAVSKVSLHESLFLRARQGKLPLAGPLYRNFGMPHMGYANIGTITEMTENGFRVKTLQDETLMVIITPKTSFPAGIDFQKDDRVMILGGRSDGAIKADGVRRIDDTASGGMMRQRSPYRGGWFMPMMK